MTLQKHAPFEDQWLNFASPLGRSKEDPVPTKNPKPDSLEKVSFIPLSQ